MKIAPCSTVDRTASRASTLASRPCVDLCARAALLQLHQKQDGQEQAHPGADGAGAEARRPSRPSEQGSLEQHEHSRASSTRRSPRTPRSAAQQGSQALWQAPWRVGGAERAGDAALAAARWRTIATLTPTRWPRMHAAPSSPGLSLARLHAARTQLAVAARCGRSRPTATASLVACLPSLLQVVVAGSRCTIRAGWAVDRARAPQYVSPNARVAGCGARIKGIPVGCACVSKAVATALASPTSRVKEDRRAAAASGSGDECMAESTPETSDWTHSLSG